MRKQDQLSEKEVVIFIAITQEIIYLQYLLSILSGHKFNESNITLCILEGNTQLSRSFYWKHAERREKVERIIDTVSNFENTSGVKIKIRFAYEDKPAQIPNLERLSDLLEIDQVLYNSIRSVLATSSTRTAFYDYPIRKFKKKVVALTTDYFCAKEMVRKSGLLDNAVNKTFVFLNGRHPGQAAIRQSIEESGLKFLSFEWGQPEHQRFHFQNFQVQELTKLQDSWLLERKNFDEAQRLIAAKEANQWLIAQSNSKSVNRFLTSGSPETIHEYSPDGSNQVTIFTSSVEEDIYNLGEETNGWESQVQAIIECAKFFVENSYTVLIRIHPNAGNKSWLDLAHLTENLDKERISYIFPWSQVSSYSLISESSIVGTWVSTIGIEAAARGVPTFTLGVSPYSKASGILVVNPQNFRDSLQLLKGNMDKEAIMLTIYQMHNFGYEIKEHSEGAFIALNERNELLDPTNLLLAEKILYFSKKVKNRVKRVFPIMIGPFATPNSLDHYFGFLDENLRGQLKHSYLNFLKRRLKLQMKPSL